MKKLQPHEVELIKREKFEERISELKEIAIKNIIDSIMHGEDICDDINELVLTVEDEVSVLLEYPETNEVIIEAVGRYLESKINKKEVFK